MNEELLALERQGAHALTSGRAATFYRDVLSDAALMVVPGYIVDKAMFLSSIGSAAPWVTFAIEDARVVPLTPECGVVLYRGRGTRPGQAEYVARISSTYVKRGNAWKLAFHQQTPEPAP